MSRSGRLIFDITDMVRFAHENWQVTGIARVSLTLAWQAFRLRPDIVRIGYFDAVTRTYRVLRDPTTVADASRLRSHLKQSTGYVKQLKVWKHRKRSFRLEYHRLNRWLAIGAERVKQLVWRHRFADPRLSFEAGDRLIFLGGGWGALDAFAYLNRDTADRDAATEIVALVHDAIPLVMPSFSGTVDQRLFTHWLRQMLASNATFLFYSESSGNDLKSWCARQGVERIPSRRFRLGDDLISSGGGPIREEVRCLQDTNYILCVGSVAGRKNGAKLILALRMLQITRRDRQLPALVLAGSTTHNELKEILGGDPGLDRLVHINRANDTELSFLYRHCRFTVFPSLYEGWGLPIGESLWHGKICATSNCSSMPEVGGPACDYFDPHDPQDIARTLEPLIFDDGYLAERMSAIDRSKLRSWRESADELIRILGEAPQWSDLRPDQYSSAAPVQLANREQVGMAAP
jgi:glycosyltransferase involved in cell wall biosynthesis